MPIPQTDDELIHAWRTLHAGALVHNPHFTHNTGNWRVVERYGQLGSGDGSRPPVLHQVTLVNVADMWTCLIARDVLLLHAQGWLPYPEQKPKEESDE